MAAVKRSAPSPAVGHVLASSPAGSALALPVQQLFDRCLDIDRQLRASLRKKSFYDVEVRQLKQQLKELYEVILFKDYGHAQNHDVEQLLWKSVFYSTIEGFRQRIQTAGKAGEPARDAVKKVTAAYVKFLDESRLFYKELLYKLQRVYGDVGISVDLETAPRVPKPSGSQGMVDCRVSAHRCLIYLGDISRYKAQLVRSNRTDWQMASKYYQQAGRVHPRSGNPYNQLGVIAFYLKDELRAVYYYFRSLSVATPFLTARENLKLLFEKNRGRYSLVSGRNAGKPLNMSNTADAKQALSTLSSDLSTCFVRLCGIMFDHINTEQFNEAKELAFVLLRQLLASSSAMELLSGVPATDSILVHLLVLSVFSVYNTEGQASRRNGPANSMELLQLNRYHHQAVAVAFQFGACVMEAAAENYAHPLVHMPLGAVTFLLLNWILAQPQLVMQQYNPNLQQDEVVAQTSFWKALCQLVLKFGEAVKQGNVGFRQKSPGLLPEEVEFRGFEPFRVTAADLSSDVSLDGNTALLRMVRCIQCCREVADMMQHHLSSVSVPDPAASSTPAGVRPSATATLAQYAACNTMIQAFCSAVDSLYEDKLPLTEPATNRSHAKPELVASLSMGAASSVEQGSSPMNTATSASARIEPQSGSSEFRTFSSGADAPPLLEDLPTVASPAAAACAVSHGHVQVGTDGKRLHDEAQDLDLEEEEEVIVFQPQHISRPPSRAPELPSGTLSAGGSGISRVASAASFPVSPTIAAHQEFNLFANDASLALHKLVTSGVHLEQQLSMDSIRSEVSGGLAGRELASSTPRAEVASPSASLKVSPAAGSLPEPPAEWTASLQPLSGGSWPSVKPSESSNPSPKHPPLPQPSSMPPPPPTSLQLAAMAGSNVSTAVGYGFGAIGAHRNPTSAPAVSTQPSAAASAGFKLLQPDDIDSSLANWVNSKSSMTTSPQQHSPTVNAFNQASPTAKHTSPPSGLSITDPTSSHSLTTLLQKLQRRPVSVQSSSQLQTAPGPPSNTGPSSTLHPQPPSPSLRVMCPSPQQQLFSAAVQPPSRLSLGSAEQVQAGRMNSQGGFAQIPPAPAVHWGVTNVPTASLSAVTPVMPLPGFRDVLTLTQLEQATLAAHEESVANDQAEATAIAAAGQLLDDQSPPLHAMVVQPGTLPSVALPPMPSEKFLSTPVQQAQNVAVQHPSEKFMSFSVQSSSSSAPAPAAMQPPGPPAPSMSMQQLQQSSNSTQPCFLSSVGREGYPMVAVQVPSHSQQPQPPGHPLSIPFDSQLFTGLNPVDAVRSSITLPPGSGSISPALSAAAVPQSSFAQPRVTRMPEREIPNAGFSFLDILEVHHTQGGDYNTAAHLYNPSIPEPTAASFPMLLSSSNLGYRTAEPLPQ